jgi:phage-related tail fiber protein
MATPLFIPAIYHDGPNFGQILIPYVDVLPVQSTSIAAILAANVGPFEAGMYVYSVVLGWQFAMPIEAVSAIVLNGDGTEIYVNVTSTVTLGPTSIVYLNGQLQTGHDLPPAGTSVYAVRLPKAITGAVTAVNGMGGDINLVAGPNMQITDDGAGTITFESTGGSPYTLPPATPTVLGGVIVPAGSNIAVDGSGNIDLSSAALANINGKISNVVSTGAGTSLVSGVAAGVASLKSLAAGTNVTFSEAGGVLTINSTGGMTSVTLTGDVTGTGSGTVPTLLAPSGVAAGTYTKVTVDAKGRVTVGANPTTLAGFGIVDALPLSGGSMTGAITMTSGSTVTGVPDPVNPLDAVNKQSLDAALAAAANGTNWKGAVDAATTGNITLSGLQTIDGIALTAGKRALVKDQTDQKTNGVYDVSAGAWTRSADSDTSAELYKGAVLVLAGTANGLTQWTNTNSVAPVVGTDNITYGQLKGAANVYAAGAGLSLTGLTFAIAATGVTVGTYTKVTVNAQGQVVTGANLSLSDITTAIGYTPYNGTTNPNGYIGTSSPINITGDASGTGTTAIALTLATTGVVAGTYTKVTVDSKGRVTVGANLTNAEIVAAIGYTPANKAGDTFGGAVNFAPYVTAASAATTPIGAALANDINISGTTTITAFDVAPAGSHRWLTFGGILTLTHNGASMILPTGANIVTAAGDTAEFVSLGAGNWKCVNYMRASGQSLGGGSDPTKLPLTGGTLSGALNLAPFVLLASAATLAIGAANANDITVTGTTAITAFDTIGAGAHRTLTFAGALTLTHNSLSLILPSGANIVTAAGDVAEFVSLGAGNWRCVNYQKANGQAVIGGGSPYSTTQVFNGDVTQEAAKFTNVAEQALIIGSAPAATQNFYVASGAVQFHTVNATASWIINFAHSASQTLNSAMAIGDSITVAHMASQGTTAFFPSTFRIDGSVVIPKWQGGSAPSAGNPSGIDVYSYTIIKTGNSTFTVLASQTQFK